MKFIGKCLTALGVTLLTTSCVHSFTPSSSSFVQTQSNSHLQQRLGWTTITSPSFSSSPLKAVVSFDSTESSSDSENEPVSQLPQAFATGYSNNPDLLLAITEAVTNAVYNLPPPPPHLTKMDNQIDVAFLTISSLYDNQSIPMTTVVPTLLTTAMNLYGSVKNVVGSTAGGIVSWQDESDDTDDDVDVGDSDAAEGSTSTLEANKNVQVIESEGTLGVSVTLALLPDVELQAFHVEEEDVPDDVGRVPVNIWKSAMKLQNFHMEEESDDNDNDNDNNDNNGAIFLLPSPAFQTSIDDLLEGFKYAYPGATIFGGLASTVSSLSRARLFLYKEGDSTADPTVYNDGCIGIGMKGDIQVQILVAQGAKPVGGVYRIVDGEESTIRVIVADEDASANKAEDSSDETTDWKEMYAKALIPKPPLAEANQIMKRLNDDNSAFMKKSLLIGLEQGGSLGRTPNELERLKNGEGHAYLVRQVASAGMKDGSVTLPLESVSVQKGGRMRFFVREAEWCKKEVEAIWCGYKKKILQETFLNSGYEDNKESTSSSFTPSACFMISTMDRGSKLFGGEKKKIGETKGYEGNEVKKYLPTVNSIAGFYGNGVLAGLDGSFKESGQTDDVILHGSASCYAVFGSKSNRPTFNAAVRRSQKKEKSVKKATSKTNNAAPRKENGELFVKRREIHSGRALSVSTVEWSVAEKTAQPTSALEGYMWDKETEVDRFRERVPLANLLSQCKLAMSDPTNPAPRDWISNVKKMIAESDGFAIVPECKRTEVVGGSLRERYDPAKLAGQFVSDGDAQALSVNCDAVLFGGSLEDIGIVREACGADVPLLASDLLLYPYQLYKLRLAGADAVYLIAAALEGKDFLYLSKIAKSLNLQTVISVTSEVQIELLTDLLPPGTIDSLVISNRELETFGFDESGKQALSLLESNALSDFKEKHGEDVLILVEGRVGMESLGLGGSYIDKLKKLGASGAIVGQALAELNDENGGEALKSFGKKDSVFE